MALVAILLSSSALGDENSSEPAPPVTELNTQPADSAPAETIGETDDDERSQPAANSSIELSLGLSYSRSDRREGLRVQRSRSASIPLSVTYRPTPALGLSTSVSFVYGERDLLTFSDFERETSAETADITLGVTYRWLKASASFPGLTTSLDVGIPTGSDAGSVDIEDPVDDPDAYTAALIARFDRTVDPVLLYWDFGLAHAFENGSDNTSPREGDALQYGFGTSFVVNGAISFTAGFSGSFVRESEIAGKRVPGTSREPMYLSARVNYSSSRDQSWQGSLTQGLNDDAGDVQFGLTFSRSL